MRLNERQMGRIARAALKRLRDNNLAQVSDAAAASGTIRKVLAANVAEEAKIEEQARAIMQQFDAEIRRGDVEFHELFKKIKRKLADEQGFVL